MDDMQYQHLLAAGTTQGLDIFQALTGGIRKIRGEKNVGEHGKLSSFSVRFPL
jgi:hypothetical protein